MKLIKFTLFITLLVITNSYVAKAQSVEEIINKHIEATGGADNYAKWKSVKYTGKVQGQPGMDFPMTMAVVDGKGIRLDIVVQNMTMTMAMNGKSGWMIQPFNGKKDAEPMPEDQVKAMADQLDITGELYNYSQKGNKVELVGDDEMDGTEVYKLKVERPNGNITYHYIDKESFFDLKQTQIVKIEGKEVEGSTMLSNFQKTPSGIIVPYAMDGGMGPVRWDNVEINPEISESTFDMPKPASSDAPMIEKKE